MMKNIKAAVFFIDILGVGALTNGKVSLRKPDFVAWRIHDEEKQNHHYFSARLLQHFRNALIIGRHLHKSVKFAQLSDCAFLWSSSLSKLLTAATNVMWDISDRGLLCRGGLSYGNILLPDKTDIKLGSFVMGSAATNAVKNERSDKGARIFFDEKLLDEVKKEPRIASMLPIKAINETSFYEYEWFRLPPNSEQPKLSLEQHLNKLIDLYTTFTFCPKLSWNSRTIEGLEQLTPTIDAFAQGLEDLSEGIISLPSRDIDANKNQIRTNKARRATSTSLKRLVKTI